ncbi:class I SAM-dependent methyltransferase [archaeon]|nr:class I SAM-dependent methyltransferase [archaeon]
MDKEKQFKEYDKTYNKYVYSKINKNKKVLDLGCNTGLLGEALKKNKNCIVYGADYSKEAIILAKKRLDYSVVCNLEKEVPFESEKFDVIVLADILEHLKDPENLLNKIKNLLKKEGVIISCIPNVANINIRFQLLFGKWDYKKSGILDKTHLRFFTKKTMKLLFENKGYKIIKIDSTPGFEFFCLYHFKILKRIKENLCNIYPSLFANQFIILSKKNQ